MARSSSAGSFSDKRTQLILSINGIVILLSLGAIGYALASHRPADAGSATACTKPGQGYYLTVDHDKLSEDQLTVRRCDTITITNTDDLTYWFNFGPHSHHIQYPGFEPTLQHGHSSVTITAVQTGSYLVHDHLRDTAELHLTVE